MTLHDSFKLLNISYLHKLSAYFILIPHLLIDLSKTTPVVSGMSSIILCQPHVTIQDRNKMFDSKVKPLKMKYIALGNLE